ncbi:TetR/AcrR family transcriptional regulator [Mesorhizobium sp. CGMCC 1.15528]|uniref:TetR/AcrR family transcriptional regulator n=1 Tax=Mesorhizobium zhangyense TaxID=1776730 RepID=A0A7C9R8H9_9HYPH|nr:TetR/AcrR family transcriptional regulator [Mesorhizobium zhangyense]NGN42158.1 TetR/AcrR family transcriptional regulator [Mesorhizobium zhangyense]
MLETTETATDPKRARILDGALKMFLAYGFSRTTMDDIARAAEVSRPALYLLFKNKTDIYRALASVVFEESIAKARAELAGDAPLGERLFQVIDTALISVMAKIAESPHGAEILDMKGSLAGDVVEGWRAAMVGQFTAAIGEEARATGVDLAARDLSPVMLADVLFDGLEGMKMRVSGAEEQRKAVRGLVKMVELAIRP